MELFVSQFVNKIDKKGRVSLPSIFRNALPQNSKNEIILYKSLKHNSIEGCSSDRIKDIADRMKKPLGFQNVQELRNLIKKEIEIKNYNNKKNITNHNFIEKEILVHPIDYYYTNAIARSSKVMGECRKISKSYIFTGIDKAS